MRINQDPNNAAYGYSFLIDSDQQFGITGSNVDPNARVGNPGFEYEILFASGNSGGVEVRTPRICAMTTRRATTTRTA